MIPTIWRKQKTKQVNKKQTWSCPQIKKTKDIYDSVLVLCSEDRPEQEMDLFWFLFRTYSKNSIKQNIKIFFFYTLCYSQKKKSVFVLWSVFFFKMKQKYNKNRSCLWVKLVCLKIIDIGYEYLKLWNCANKELHWSTQFFSQETKQDF